LPFAQSTVSQHLKIPKEAGLVEGIIKQPAIACHLKKDNWHQAKKVLNKFFED